MVRVLVTAEPRMYREVIALAVHKNRPETEVVLAPESAMEGQVDGFAPHVLVRNHGDGVISERVLGSVVCRVEVLYTDSIAARVSVGGRAFTIEDASVGDLLWAVDKAAEIADREESSG
jgi:hypothetical protein